MSMRSTAAAVSTIPAAPVAETPARLAEVAVPRRSLLKATALSALGGPLPLACGASSEDERSRVFRHGVASGDPWPESVLLWTRVSVTKESASGRWEVFDSPTLETLVQDGGFQTDASRDHTVKVEATGLAPNSTYYFRFHCDGQTSPIGRTRTAPDGETERLRLLVFSCAAYSAGHFLAYGAGAARLDVAAVLHLGDYIYEHGNGEFGSLRDYDPPYEILSLADYRRRYAHYRLDPDLQALHQQHPILAIWDDHEVANDAWKDGAQNHQTNEGDYADRKKAAQQAYFEWLPIRETEPGRVHRSFQFGDLIDLIMLDTRHWGRDRQLPFNDPDFAAASRTILGADQEAWLNDELVASRARWRVVAQQVMVSSLPEGIGNNDAWEGYPANRQRLYDFVSDQGFDNLVILTGDIHMSWAFDVVPDETETYDPDSGQGSIAVELVAPSVTSPSLDRQPAEALAEAALETPRVRLAQLWKRGYLLLDVNHERLHAEWYLFERVDRPVDPVAREEFYAALEVRAGETHLRAAEGPAPALDDAPAAAPS